MKTKNFFSRLSATALVAAAVLLPAALTSCSSDGEPNTPTPDPIPEGMARINFGITSPTTATRGGTATVTADEGTINSLWVYFFKVDDSNNGTLKYAFDIKENVSVGASGGTISTMNTVTTTAQTVVSGMNIEQGKYRIYVLANLKDRCSLAPTASSSFAESAITGASFTEATGVITDKNLPMAANCTELSVSSTSSDNYSYSSSTGIVEIKAGTIEVTAPMTILCSKVRFTCFFDNTANTGFSLPYTSFALNGSSQVKKVNTKTGVFGAVDNQAAATDAANITLARKDYPASDALAKWLNENESYLADLTGSGAGTNQYAYQGYIYLTENTASTKNDKTYLEFNTTLGVAGSLKENRTFPVTLPTTDNSSTDDNDILKRGNFYDVVAKITGTGFQVYVKVNDWKDAPDDTFEF